MTSRRARETSSDAIENTILKKSYIVPDIVSLAPIETNLDSKTGKKLAKFGYLTLKYDLFDIEDKV